jgi:hypothetical protein
MFLFVACLCSIDVVATAQPGHFNSGLFSSSDFVVMGERFKIDTVTVAYIPSPSFEVPPALFAHGYVDRATVNWNTLNEFVKRDSLRIAGEFTATHPKQQDHAKNAKKRRPPEAVYPPPEPLTYVSLEKKIIRYTYRISGLYKNCYLYGNQLQQAELKRNDTVFLLLFAGQLDSTSRRELENKELVIYFNEQYHNEQVPVLFKTATLEAFFHKEKMYWIDPKRVRKLEDIIQR